MPANPTEPLKLSEIRMLRVIKGQPPTARGEFFHGLRHGHWVFYYSCGTRWQEGNFLRGLRQGRWTIWSEDGRVASFGDYLDGRRHGRWVFFLDHRRAACIYHRGKVIGLRISSIYPTCS